MGEEYGKSECEKGFIGGNSIDVQVKDCDCEIKADITVSEVKSVRIWGQVKTCKGQPVAHALVKLLKIVKKSCDCEYHGVAHTITDCKGFYQFDLCSDEMGCSYKILVSKAVTGCERTIHQEKKCNSCDCCNSCDSCDCCDPCDCCDAPYECKPTKNCNCK